MKTFSRLLVAAASLFLFIVAAPAATNYWNTTAYGAFLITNETYWTLGTPNATDTLYLTNGAYDTSVLTNNANWVSAKVWFDYAPADGGNPRRSSIYFSQPWTVTDTLDVGHDIPDSKTVLFLRSGTLAVTNTSGTAQLNVNARTGLGGVALEGGTLIADHLYTAFASFVPSMNWESLGISGVNGGTLTTLGDSILTTNAGGGSLTFYLGTRRGVTGTWNVLGGTNRLDATEIKIGSNPQNIGGSESIVGHLLVSGSDTVLFSSNTSVSVGGAGYHGLLTVANGARLDVNQIELGFGESSGASNLVQVIGSNSTLRVLGQTYLGHIGSLPSNQLLIEDGGRLFGGGAQLYLGYDTGSSGENLLAVVGAGSLITNYPTIEVGGAPYVSGRGLLVVSNGGAVRGVSTLDLGFGNYGEMRLTGPGSIFTSTSTMNVGSNSWDSRILGTGVVSIADGAIYEGNAIAVGDLGAVTNAGGVFQFTAAPASLSLVVNGAGSLVLTNGVVSFRAINNASPLVAGTPLANMTYQGDVGFQLNAATNAAGLTSYTFDNAYGATNYQRLILANGALWRSDNLQVGAGGAIHGSGTIQANMVTNRGVIAPGQSPGELVFTSNLTLLSSSVLNLELAGTNASLYDRITVNGAFAIDGALNVTLLNGFLPQVGDTFQLFNFDPSLLSGMFTFTNFASLPGDRLWDASALYTSGVLGVIPIPEPATWMLGLTAAATCALLARRRAR